MILIRTHRNGKKMSSEEQHRDSFHGGTENAVGIVSEDEGIYSAIRIQSSEGKELLITSSADGFCPVSVGKNVADILKKSISEITEIPFSDSFIYVFDISDWVRVIENSLDISSEDERAQLRAIASKTEPSPEGTLR